MVEGAQRPAPQWRVRSCQQRNTPLKVSMRRQNVLLLVQARHDPTAKREVGRRYLLGIEGLSRHVATGIGYLTHASLQNDDEAATIICECLTLQEIVSFQQQAALLRAARFGNPVAQFKLALWVCVRHGQLNECASWLDTAAAGGHELAARARAALRIDAGEDGVLGLSRTLSEDGAVDVEAIATLAATVLADEGKLYLLARCLRIALAASPRLSPLLARLVVRAVHLAEAGALCAPGLATEHVEASLDLVVCDGDAAADYVMEIGRAHV